MLWPVAVQSEGNKQQRGASLFFSPAEEKGNEILLEITVVYVFPLPAGRSDGGWGLCWRNPTAMVREHNRSD